MDYLGGCQCGAIRYRAQGPRDHASVCYCRMCQKAGGGPFMAFVRFPAARVSWSAPPAVFASSNVAERGFCRHCGTPLSYRFTSGPNVSLTILSLDEPDAVRPEVSFSAPAQPDWCRTLAEIPALTFDLRGTPGFTPHQR